MVELRFNQGPLTHQISLLCSTSLFAVSSYWLMTGRAKTNLGKKKIYQEISVLNSSKIMSSTINMSLQILFKKLSLMFLIFFTTNMIIHMKHSVNVGHYYNFTNKKIRGFWVEILTIQDVYQLTKHLPFFFPYSTQNIPHHPQKYV